MSNILCLSDGVSSDWLSTEFGSFYFSLSNKNENKLYVSIHYHGSKVKIPSVESRYFIEGDLLKKSFISFKANVNDFFAVALIRSNNETCLCIKKFSYERNNSDREGIYLLDSFSTKIKDDSDVMVINEQAIMYEDLNGHKRLYSFSKNSNKEVDFSDVSSFKSREYDDSLFMLGSFEFIDKNRVGLELVNNFGKSIKISTTVLWENGFVFSPKVVVEFVDDAGILQLISYDISIENELFKSGIEYNVLLDRVSNYIKYLNSQCRFDVYQRVLSEYV